MFTVCPKCTLTLVVTTVDLRAGQGYVRCGRCANVFNALIALREGDPSVPTVDTSSGQLQQTAPQPPANPAMGSGVAMDPEPEPEPEPDPEPEPELESTREIPLEPDPEFAAIFEAAAEAPAEDESAPETEITLESAPEGAESEEISLEFDPSATDVSEIFVPGDEGAGSGSFESIVLAVEPDPQPAADAAAFAEPEFSEDQPLADEVILEEPAGEDAFIEEPGVPEAVSGSDWSLLDDDDPPADEESVIEESPLASGEPLDEPTMEEELVEADEPTVEEEAGDPAWVEEMFAEAEEAERQRTAERETLQAAEAGEDTLIEAARASTGSAAPSDTVLEPLLAESAPPRPAWPHVAGVVALALVLVGQIIHHHRQSLVLNDTLGPALSRVYGWFGATITPRWDLLAYDVVQRGAEAEGGASNRLFVRMSLHNKSTRVQPMPLLRLTLQDLYGNPVATRDLEPAEYLPASRADLRALGPDQRIDAELHVVDPGRKAIGFIIDACLRAENGAIGCSQELRLRPAG